MMSSLQEIMQAVTDIVDGILGRYQIEKFTKKVRTRGSNTIISWNVFPESLSLLEDVFKNLTARLDDYLKGINGEVIRFENAHGEIWDRHYNQFVVIRSFISEVYWYDPEIFAYIRVLHELDKISSERRQWISIDVDLVTDSAWFLD